MDETNEQVRQFTYDCSDYESEIKASQLHMSFPDEQSQRLDYESYMKRISNNLFNAIEQQPISVPQSMSEKTECKDVQKCEDVQNVIQLMQKCKHIEENNMNSLIEDMQSVNITQYLNAYNHILQFHLDYDMIEYCRKIFMDDIIDYQYIYEQLSSCDILTCPHIRRNERDRNIFVRKKDETENNAYQTLHKDKDIALVQLLDSMHCGLYHQFDYAQWTMDEQIEFLNEIKDEIPSKQQNESETLQLDGILQKSESYIKAINLRRKRLTNLRQKNSQLRYCNKFWTETNEESNAKYENDIESKYEHIHSNESTDENTLPIYRFGEAYSYFNESHVTNCYPFWSNMKAELLNNKLFKISLDDWKQTLQKAYQKIKCEIALNVKALPNRPRMYGIKDDSPLNIELLLSVLFYCNFDDLQRNLSETYRLMPIDKGSTFYMRKRHEQFTQWARLLSTMVHCYGTVIVADGSTSFYHGLSDHFIFEKTQTFFLAPTSTSTSPVVASSFTANYGFLLTLSCQPDVMHESAGTSKFRGIYIERDVCALDCAWISDFPYEKEWLFIGDGNGISPHSPSFLAIKDIMNSETGESYFLFIDAIKFIKIIFCDTRYGSQFSSLKIESDIKQHMESDEEKNPVISKASVDAVRMLLECKLGKARINNRIRYVYNMFQKKCSEFRNIYINTKDISNFFLAPYCISQIETNKSLLNMPNIDFLCRLFPNMNCLNIYQQVTDSLFEQIIFWMIKNERNQQISDILPNEKSSNKLVKIKFRNVDNEAKNCLSFDQVISKYNKLLKKQYWKMEKFCDELHLICCRRLIFDLLATLDANNCVKINVVGFESWLSYAQYKIQIEVPGVNNESMETTRRYSEFYKLYEYLRDNGLKTKCKFPSKQWFKKSTDEQLIQERMIGLGVYLQQALDEAQKMYKERKKSDCLKEIFMFVLDCINT